VIILFSGALMPGKRAAYLKQDRQQMSFYLNIAEW
jgi:hypothetical protein